MHIWPPIGKISGWQPKPDQSLTASSKRLSSTGPVAGTTWGSPTLSVMGVSGTTALGGRRGHGENSLTESSMSISSVPSQMGSIWTTHAILRTGHVLAARVVDILDAAIQTILTLCRLASTCDVLMGFTIGGSK
jgi:hypothetical protein